MAALALLAATDIGPRCANVFLRTGNLAGLPTIGVEVLEIGAGAVDFILRLEVAFGDEIARSGIAARVFNYFTQGMFEPAVPIWPLDSRLDPGIGLAARFAATGGSTHQRRRRVKIGVVVAGQVGAIDREGRAGE